MQTNDVGNVYVAHNHEKKNWRQRAIRPASLHCGRRNTLIYTRYLVLNKQPCAFFVHSLIEQKHGSTAQSKGREKDCAHIHYVGTICQGCTEDIDVVRGPYLARLTSNVGNERHMTRPLATEKHAIASSNARSRTNGLPPGHRRRPSRSLGRSNLVVRRRRKRRKIRNKILSGVRQRACFGP